MQIQLGKQEGPIENNRPQRSGYQPAARVGGGGSEWGDDGQP